MSNDLSHECEIGELSLQIEAPPVSLQSTRGRKDVLTDLIREHTAQRNYLVSGDVHVDLEWMQNERWRYETHLSPDVDNILKPAIDAMCGPSGVLLDDCQVQSLSCRWIDWTRQDQRFEIRVRFSPVECVPKKGLAFVRMAESLCFPFNIDVPPIQLMGLVSSVITAWRAKDELLRLGADAYTAGMVMPVQRIFNRAKIAEKFTVQDLPAFMQSVRIAAEHAVSAASEREVQLYQKLSPQFLLALCEAEKRFAC